VETREANRYPVETRGVAGGVWPSSSRAGPVSGAGGPTELGPEKPVMTLSRADRAGASDDFVTGRQVS